MSLFFHEQPHSSYFIENIPDKEIMNKLGSMIKNRASSVKIRTKSNNSQCKCFHFDKRVLKELSEKMKTHKPDIIKKFLGLCIVTGSLRVDDSNTKKQKCTNIAHKILQNSSAHKSEQEHLIEHEEHFTHEEHHINEEESHKDTHIHALREHEGAHPPHSQEPKFKSHHESSRHSSSKEPQNEKQIEEKIEQIEEMHRREEQFFDFLETEEQQAADQRHFSEQYDEEKKEEIQTTVKLCTESINEDVAVDLHADDLNEQDAQSDDAVHNLQKTSAQEDKKLRETIVDPDRQSDFEVYEKQKSRREASGK